MNFLELCKKNSIKILLFLENIHGIIKFSFWLYFFYNIIKTIEKLYFFKYNYKNFIYKKILWNIYKRRWTHPLFGQHRHKKLSTVPSIFLIHFTSKWYKPNNHSLSLSSHQEKWRKGRESVLDWSVSRKWNLYQDKLRYCTVCRRFDFEVRLDLLK